MPLELVVGTWRSDSVEHCLSAAGSLAATRRRSLMRNLISALAILILATCFATDRAMAQGPAGAGAGVAAGGGSTAHSYNPLKFFGKRDAKAAEPTLAVEELDKRLEPKLRAAQLLGAGASLKDVCANFVERVDCLASLHASHNLGLDFECVKSNVTGVRVGSDTSSCRMPSGDKPLSLMKTIHLLKSDADAKNAAKDAETAARDDIRDVTS